MKHPFFSIIIPAYNRKNFLKIAINSVMCQTFSNFELIIIDDGSDDNTKGIMQEFNDERITYLYQSHKGVSAARNRGVELSQGKFICFLDSDDRFRKQKLEITYNYIQQNPQYKIFHTEEIWYRKGKLLSQKERHKKPSGFVFENAVKLCCISISTAAIKKEVFDKIGLFDEKLPVCEDYDFWLRVTSKFPVFLIPKYLTIKEGGHLDQQSKRYPAMDKFRIYALQKILESRELNEENYRIAFNELKYKCSIYIKGAAKRKKIEEVDYYNKLILRFENQKLCGRI
jgi:glycosyltransferase involved in cell wall biosynthesis